MIGKVLWRYLELWKQLVNEWATIMDMAKDVLKAFNYSKNEYQNLSKAYWNP
jgi:hypothetical protein